MEKDENNEPYIHVTMGSMLKDIIQSYEQVIGEKIKMQDIPGYPNQSLRKTTDSKKIVKEKGNRSLIGKILYSVNKMTLACCNAIRELHNI